MKKAVFLLFATLLVAGAETKSNSRSSRDENPARTANRTWTYRGHAPIVRADYQYHRHNDNLPPGLAKRNSNLPAGVQKKDALPPGPAKRNPTRIVIR